MICAAGRVTPRFLLHLSSKPEFNRLLSVVPQRRYVPSRLDNIENVEEYRPGGFHPISIGDVLAKGRYKVLHKLGFGGSSTVWLARDQRPQQPPVPSPTTLGPLVALKVLSAELSSELKKSEIAELALPILLAAFLRVSDTPVRHHVQVVEDHFMEEGPNGVHLCLVYPFAGPSVRSMLDSPGRVSGSRRLRADLARKVAKQTATAVDLFHCAGLVHGGLSYSGVQVVHSSDVW
jgi:serine/threonine-protein kinase SRPK3